ncbi:hypothetical protein L1987_60344 [Smallanthus sonchifolius]|uniref:Uncharacterized protein n=1 Tax=Smallanthus sonchifolius TaxID=185202 RepID=A0ACB9D7W3_9ASTR|nr:hypothetical protein L1987_60344 [Smallanthus sonchifolius]
MSQQCDRLTKLLNELRAKVREYDTDEVLEKFLRFLLAQWRMYTISIRNSYELKKVDLVELHGMLKTYELEMIQDSKLLNSTKKGVEVSNQTVAFFTPSVSTSDNTITFPTQFGIQIKDRLATDIKSYQEEQVCYRRLVDADGRYRSSFQSTIPKSKELRLRICIFG